MNELTKEFEQNWQDFIEKEVETISRSTLFPIHFVDVNGVECIRTLDEFKADISRLQNEKFTIAVCGAVKAGKSTFLNSLLFGKDVLPAFSTPMTAKLNFIEYSSDKDHFEVNFYSSEEWKRLLDTLDEDNRGQLEERIEICQMEFGVSEDDYIGRTSETINDLNVLEEYVSDPKAGKGKYTPFVKDVHIRINNPQIEKLCIVDTPGLNDPNTINSDETVKWIRNAHAVIFLLRPKGYEASDKAFVDKNLVTTRPENRLWIINKIDDLGDMKKLESVKNYMRELGRSEEFKAKNLFGEREKICGYSALISMLNRMQENNEELNEEQEEILDIMPDDFNPDPDNVPGAVSARLYENIGEKRIAAGIAMVEDIYAKKAERAKNDFEEAIRNLKNVETDEATLREEIKKIKDTAKSLQAELEKFQQDYKRTSLRSIAERLAGPAIKKIESFQNRICGEINSASETAQLLLCGQSFQRQLHSLFGATGAILKFSDDCQKELNKPLIEICKTVRRSFEEAGIDNTDIDFSPLENISDKPFNTGDLVEEMQSDLERSLPSDFLSNLFTSKAAKRAICSRALGDAVNRTLELLDENVKEFHNSVLSTVKAGFDKFSDSIKKSCLEKEKNIGLDPEELKKKKCEFEQKKNDAEKTLQTVSSLMSAYESKLPANLRSKKVIMEEK